MPTEKPRVTITVSKEQLEEIEAYRFGNKMKNQTQAILSLVRLGLDELSKQERTIIEKTSDAYNGASEIGVEVAAFRSILEKSNIVKPGSDISQSDLEFLKGMFLALKAHFEQRNEQLK